MQRRSFVSSIALLAALPAASQAQPAWPARPVRIVVPAAAGSADVFARALARKLEPALGQPVIVEQRAGAGTNIGNAYVARSAPDGYTLLINGLPLATNPALYSNLGYNPAKDLVPVSEVAAIANVVTVHPGLTQIQTLRDLVAAAKAEPGRFNHGTPGAGSSGHLSAELLTLKTGARFTHVPYQGNAQATNDHLAGLLQIGFVNMPVALQFVRANRLRALAVTSAKRSPLMPEVPTVAEALGIPDYELSGWFGIFAPAGTPAAVVSRLESEFGKALRDPEIAEVITKAGGDVLTGGSAQLHARLARDTERLTEVVRASGAKAE